MNKTEFLQALRAALGKLPSYEVEQSIAFYAEMIDDRVEDGMNEQDAVAGLGAASTIAAQIIAETPAIPKAIARANTGSRTLNVVLLAVFSPIWVPIAFALALTALAVYLSIWMVIVSLWMVVAILILGAPLGVIALVDCVVKGFPLTGVLLFGGGLACTGMGLFAWFGVLGVSKGLVHLTHVFARWIKGLFKKQPNERSLEETGAPEMPAGMPTSQTVPLTAPAHIAHTEGAQNHDYRA